jgi:two-component system, NarL family, nitrate/nitrite response regulator NarL
MKNGYVAKYESNQRMTQIGTAMQRRTFATVLVGPNALTREGLARILRAAGFRIVASAPCINGAFLSALSHDQIVLLVLDAGSALPAAIPQIEAFKEHCPDGRVAVLANDHQLVDIVSAYRAGANSYFVNLADATSFVKSLELVMLGETLVPPEILPLILGHESSGDDDAHAHNGETAPSIVVGPNNGGVPQLSAREECILRCLTEGDSNKTIARKINIAEATVKVHIKAILRKIRVHNRTQAAIWAVSHGAPVGAAPGIAAVEPIEEERNGELALNGIPQGLAGRKAPRPPGERDAAMPRGPAPRQRSS